MVGFVPNPGFGIGLMFYYSVNMIVPATLLFVLASAMSVVSLPIFEQFAQFASVEKRTEALNASLNTALYAVTVIMLLLAGGIHLVYIFICSVWSNVFYASSGFWWVIFFIANAALFVLDVASVLMIVLLLVGSSMRLARATGVTVQNWIGTFSDASMPLSGVFGTVTGYNPLNDTGREVV
jgi:hypothetical protein